MGMPTHLSAGEIEEFGREMDAIRNEVMESLGERDRNYILGLIKVQRSMAFIGRVILYLSLIILPGNGLGFDSWLAFSIVLLIGAGMLGTAKIIENMEIGHNVMHAQWDWMRDPNIQSNTWEWDNVCPSDQWKHSHNVVHHTWTNVFEKDPDIGYGVLRVSEKQKWRVMYLLNPFVNLIVMFLFQWGVAVHDLELDRLTRGQKLSANFKPMVARIMWKVKRQLLKDYVLWPVLGAFFSFVVALVMGLEVLNNAWNAFLTIALGNLIANGIRNVWSNIIIFCGHFPEGVEHFTKEEVEGETRARWYVRQLLGSANIGGGTLFHILSGNLSHQIEHHLFPDVPSNRYPEMAPRVRALADRYGLPYNTGTLRRQFGTTTWKIWKFSLPTS